MTNDFIDGHLSGAYDKLKNLEAALKIVGGPAVPGHQATTILDVLDELDWNLGAVKSFLEYVDGPKSAINGIEEAVEKLEDAGKSAEAGWSGTAADEFQRLRGVITQNCGTLKGELKAMAEDLDADDGESRETVSSPKSATAIMDDIMKDIEKEAGKIASATSSAAEKVRYGSVTDPDYPSAEAAVAEGFQEVKAMAAGATKRIQIDVALLTQRHTAPLTLEDPLKGR